MRNILGYWNCPPVPVKAEDDIHLLFRQLKVEHLAEEKKGNKSFFFS